VGATDILIVGGYGEVGLRMATQLEAVHPQRVVVAGRNPECVAWPRAMRVDVDDPASIEAALDGVSTVVACVRQRKPHLLRAAIRRGISYTSIASPWLPWPAVRELHEEAQRSGARAVLAAGLEPGISSVLARVGAARVGKVDSVETALLLGVGDAYGTDSLAFLLDEIAEEYEITIAGRTESVHAFERPARIDFPPPIGTRRAYTIPFRDQLYYSATLGARTAIARLALDPPWLGSALAKVATLGGRAWAKRQSGHGAVSGLAGRLRRRYADRDHFAMVVEVRGGQQVVRSTLVGRFQARATAIGATAIVEALVAGEVTEPGAWLAEQVIDPDRFLARLAAQRLVPTVLLR
jgi:saccharopine dehydrogenase-like NADP-dependent oxidoreductase